MKKILLKKICNRKRVTTHMDMSISRKRLIYSATSSVRETLKYLSSSLTGLDEDQVITSRYANGSNNISSYKAKPVTAGLAEAFINPFTVILFVLAIISSVNDIVIPYLNLFGNTPDDIEILTVAIILTMVIASGILRFVQESRSGNAAHKLLNMITTTCSVKRKNCDFQEITISEVVCGDLIHLSAGDMIPADIRIIEAKDLFVSQASLTGESEPVEKKHIVCKKSDSVTDFSNIVFMGSNVVSGTATGVVVNVGKNTLFGSMAISVSEKSVETDFTKGINGVSWVLIKFMICMVPLVFFINGTTKGDWISAFLFAVSIAVGLTPEMMPMIVTTCLAKGAVSMSKKKTIVKNLNAIQNFGAMDILCTDKTGTITQDKVVLEYHMDVHGNTDTRVLRHAYLNSYFQTGYRNLMDIAIIEKTEELEAADHSLVDLSEAYIKVDEIPFDFKRRRLSTVVEDKNGKRQMVTKGAVEEMLNICSYVEYAGEITTLDTALRNKILHTANELNLQGFRVLAIAQKSNPSPTDTFSISDESDMVLIGYLAFLDPPKESALSAIHALEIHGVKTKVLTGDNDKVTLTVCSQVGIATDSILLGNDIEQMDDLELATAVETTEIFAKLSPEQKSRIVSALRYNGHVVGFMGDGINDASAMKASDVGISVDTATDVAKESADIILLEKNLMVLEKGIIEGRKIYANMMKYIKMTASSNFGNVFSVLAASALLPFLPMTGIQILLLNLIYDLTCSAIPWDNVDQEFIIRPSRWNPSSVGKFMIWMGPVSSIFDFITYIFMYFVLCPSIVSNGILFNDLPSVYSGVHLQKIQIMYMSLFQAGWFVQSMWSQTLVIHMIRTSKLPFIQSRASNSLNILTVTGITLLTLIPFTTFGKLIGFIPLPAIYFAFLIPCIIMYMFLATIVKKAYIRKYSHLL